MTSPLFDLDSISAGYTSHNRARLVRGGREYFKTVEQLIDGAVHSIHFQTYIFENDETGTLIADALIRAAFRNVRVYLLLDGFASADLDKAMILRFQESGIHFRWFQPLVKGPNYYIGRRMHHKVIVVDGLRCLVGGVNISNRYNDMPGQPAWLDWAVQIDGEAATELFHRCVTMWTKLLWSKIGLTGIFNWRSVVAPEEAVFARIRINDWVRNKNQISRSYLEMFHRANEQITIMSSYFLPGRILRKQIHHAAKRGVHMRVILTGSSDVGLSKNAERYLYPWLLRRNVEIYEYHKSVLHGKIAVYDRLWATVGSYNLNNISAYASIELNVDIHNKAFASSVEGALDDIIMEDCVRITWSKFNRGFNFLSHFGHRLAYETYRLIFYLFTFYFRQEAKGR
jgi:cardiolipin synthase